MARSYPNFGNVKTLTLPIPDDEGMTIAQYKEKYGIDLRDVIAVDSDGAIRIIYNGLILLSDIEDNLWDSFVATGNHSVIPVSSFAIQDYESGVSDGILSIGYYYAVDNVVTGMRFFIPKSLAPSYENIIVAPTGS